MIPLELIILKDQPVPDFFRQMGTDRGKDKGGHHQKAYPDIAVNGHRQEYQFDNGTDADEFPEKLPVPDSFRNQKHPAGRKDKNQIKGRQGQGLPEKKGGEEYTGADLVGCPYPYGKHQHPIGAVSFLAHPHPVGFF